MTVVFLASNEIAQWASYADGIGLNSPIDYTIDGNAVILSNRADDAFDTWLAT